MKKQVEYLQRLFYDLWNDFGSVYLLVNYSDRSVIGRRGFTEDEKKQGLVLVFNARTSASLNWDREGNLSCVLAFGTRKEDVSIHHDDLAGVFSPEAGVRFLRTDLGAGPETASPTGNSTAGGEQVVSLSDFRKRKPTGRPRT